MATTPPATPLDCLRQDVQGRWNCDFDPYHRRSAGCRAFSTPIEALAHAYKHFDLALPKAFKVASCLYCNFSGSKSEMAKHYGSDHDGSRSDATLSLDCSHCVVAWLKTRGRFDAHKESLCPEQFASNLPRTWSPAKQLYEWDTTYGSDHVKLEAVLCIRPRLEILNAVEKVRSKLPAVRRERLETKIQELRAAGNADGTHATYVERIKALEEELAAIGGGSGPSASSLSKGAPRLSQRQHRYYFST